MPLEKSVVCLQSSLERFMAGISLTTARGLLSPCAKTAQMVCSSSHSLTTLWTIGLQLFTNDILLSSVASVLGQLVDVGAPSAKPDHSIGSLSKGPTLYWQN